MSAATICDLCARPTRDGGPVTCHKIHLPKDVLPEDLLELTRDSSVSGARQFDVCGACLEALGVKMAELVLERLTASHDTPSRATPEAAA
jgi:hypothetical protein